MSGLGVAALLATASPDVNAAPSNQRRGEEGAGVRPAAADPGVDHPLVSSAPPPQSWALTSRWATGAETEDGLTLKEVCMRQEPRNRWEDPAKLMEIVTDKLASHSCQNLCPLSTSEPLQWRPIVPDWPLSLCAGGSSLQQTEGRNTTQRGLGILGD